MRIFFGKSNDYINTTEQTFYQCLKSKNWNIYDALILLRDLLLIQNSNNDLYTLNPLILKYGVFDSYIYFIDGDNNPVKAVDDSMIQAKLNNGSSLETAMTTDSRIMN